VAGALERELTPEQRAAVEVDGSTAVRAGAGCGKTTVLAERFVHLLRAGTVEEVGQILAITFTERAAAEMRSRIRELVAAERERATGPARRRWDVIRRDLLGAQISTIHAFCARVLRENPLEAGIDPEAVVLDEHESRAYLETAVEEELVARVRAGDPAARALVLRHGLRSGRFLPGAVVLLGRFLAWLGTTGRDAAWLANTGGRQDARVPAVEAAMREAAERIVAEVRVQLATHKGKGRDALAAEWPRWETVLRGVGPDTPLADVVALRELCRLLTGARLGRKVKDDLCWGGGRLRGALADAYGFLLARPAAAALAALVGDVAERVRARKRADAVLTFADMISETRAVLGREPLVRRRYAERFRAVLVDEFQDTDRVQADVIRLLAEGPPAPLLFVVGDEKQSIYRFRGADIEVFQEVREAIGRTLPLGTNFRSQPGILEVVNALAERIFTPPAGSTATYWTRFDAGQKLVAHRAAERPGPAVRLVSFAAEHARRTAAGHGLLASEARELEARVLAGVVSRLHAEEGVAYRDVAVLFRALSEVKAYEYALRRLEVPYYVVKGRGFFQCQEVGDVLALLGAVVDDEDGIALAAALRSPFFAVDDDTLWRLARPDAGRADLTRRFRAEETFADLPAEAPALQAIRDLLLRLRRLRHRATIAELLEEAFAATDFEAVLLTQFQGAQKVANVRKLIELARDHQRRRDATLRDFVRVVRGLVASEPREPEAPLVGEEDDVVRLMTIHQAKGLEFPVVLVPDLGRQSPPNAEAVVLDEDLGVLANPIDAAGRLLLGNAALEAHREREADREHAELARLFYVACTRARDLLVLLEGKGDARVLAGRGGDGYRWCHQVWTLLGPAEVQAFAASGEPQATVVLADGGAVLLERAESYLGGPPADAARVPEPRVADAGPDEHAAAARVVGFAPTPSDEVVTSPTALADFRRCPRQYWLRHVVALPERGAGGTRATLRGTAAHGVLEALDLAAAPEAEVRRLLDARLEALVLSRHERAALAADLVTAAAALRADVAAGMEVVGREVPFVLALPAGRPRVVLNGRLDLLARRGRAHVLRDYKYAAPPADATLRHGGQLGVYQLAVHAAGAPVVEAELVFLRGGTVVCPLPPIDVAAETRALVEAGIGLGAASAGGTAEDFPKQPPGPAACEALGCGYVRRCWSAGYS
jgi:ATP-dependent helicase/nuclease subunit A